MTIEQNKKLMHDFFAAMNAGDVGTILDFYADNGDVRTMGNTLISGSLQKAEIRHAAEQIFAAFPQGVTFTILAMTAEGNRVAVEATSQGKHVSGQVYANEYHFLFELKNGTIRHLKEYLDTERVTDVLCGGQRP